MIMIRSSKEKEERLYLHRKMTNWKHSRNIQNILHILHNMLNNPEFPYPDVVSFNIVIDALGRTGWLDIMEEYFVFMMEYGVRPNVITFTCMMDACVNCLDVNRFYGTLFLMNNMGISGNECTQSTIEKFKVRCAQPDIHYLF